MKSVANATHKETKSSSSRYACLAAFVVGFLFVLSLSGGGKKEEDTSLRSGQAKHSTTAIHEKFDSSSSSNNYGTTSNGDTYASSLNVGDSKGADPPADVATSDKAVDINNSAPPVSSKTIDMEEDIVQEIEDAEEQFEEAAREELVNTEDQVNAALDKVVQSTRNALDALFTDSDILTSEDLKSLGDEISIRLRSHVEASLTTQAEEIVKEEEEEMEVEADLEAEGMEATTEEEADEIVQDLEEEEQELEGEVRSQVDDAVENILKDLKVMAAEITKELLEKLLKEKTGRSYKVYFDEEGNVSDYKKRAPSTTSGGIDSSATTTTSTNSEAQDEPKEATKEPESQGDDDIE